MRHHADDTYELQSPTQRDTAPKPITALRESFESSKYYLSTTLAPKDTSTSPKLRRPQFELEELSNRGSFCNSTINTSVEELECPEFVESEELGVEGEKTQGLESAKCGNDSSLGKVKDQDK